MSINPESVSSNSTKTFLTALVANTGLLLVEVGAFLILKNRLWRIYSPRAHLPPPQKRAQELPGGVWRWLPAIIKIPPKDIIHKNGLDAYMFLRFLKMLIKIFIVFTVLTSAIIIPADTINILSGSTQLERISWTNIFEPKDQGRFVAHIVVAYVLTFFVIYVIRQEMQHFVEMRHEFLTSKHYSRIAQARTVLITSVPEDLADERALRTWASFVPGGVDRVWLFRETRLMNKLFEERQEVCQKLEAAESELLQIAMKGWRKKQKASRRRLRDAEKHEGSISEGLDEPSRALLDELVPAKRRPHHRTGFLGLVGKKVDTVNWCKSEVNRINVELHKLREQKAKGKFLGSAFIRCNLQLGAHVLAQCVSHHKPLMMYDKWMEANPKDIVWRNLDDGALETRSRFAISWLATVGLIFAWVFPVAFIGTLSNLDDLCKNAHWLEWICSAPGPILGIVQGVVPPALLAIIFALLPLILRALAWYQCIPRYSLISISVYRRFFLFLLIHGFLIVTLTSGITRAIQGIIERPTETVQQLASELPGASIFFLTYLVTQGLAGAGNALAQFLPLIMHFIRKWFLGRTPRQAYEVTFLMPAADFGVILPRLSLLAAITFAYSLLSPLINLLALISFAMFYLAWKFLFTQVFDQPDEMETGGLYFPMAISNLFVGLYIEHLALACLFFLKSQDSPGIAAAQGGLMLALLGITAVMQILIRYSYHPITKYLPMSLATKQMTEVLKGKGRWNWDEDGEFDLFSQERIRSLRKRVRKTVKKLDKQLNQALDTLNTLKNEIIGSSDEPEQYEMTVRRPSEDDGKSWHLHDHLQRIDSRASNTSKASKISKGKLKMKVPVIDPAASSRTSSDDEEEEADDEHAFDHPSTYAKQPWIWIPKDPLGLSGVLASELRQGGVDSSDLGATMDEEGVVEVTRSPPDLDWDGGHDS